MTAKNALIDESLWYFTVHSPLRAVPTVRRIKGKEALREAIQKALIRQSDFSVTRWP